MTDQDKAAAPPETRQALLKWIEPEVRTLDVKETALLPGFGADGAIYPDCTRS